MNIILFRVDSNPTIGIGHVIRCLTLADALKEQGIKSVFICRPHHKSLHPLISDKGYDTHLLSSPKQQAKRDTTRGEGDYTTWLGTDPISDANETSDIIKRLPHPIDILCIDHYGINQDWCELIRPFTKKIITIDDLANRALDCDLIINQSPQATELQYRAIVPDYCLTLAGAEFALINPDIYTSRANALKRRKENTISTALIAFGGGDPDNFSEKSALIARDLGYTVHIIASHAFPYVSQLRQLSQLNRNIELHINISPRNVGKLITQADIAFGAAGGGALERCCLGLPTITLVTASNQTAQFNALKDANAIIPIEADNLQSDTIKKLLKRTSLDQVSKAAAELIDGEGINRVVKAITHE